MTDTWTPTADTAVYLYLDIETIPTQDAVLIAEIEARFPMPILDLDGIKADGRLKDAEKIEADIAAKRDYAAKIELRDQDIEAAYRKTCLDGTTGHIACIYHAFDDGQIAGIRLNLAPVADSDTGYPLEVDLTSVVHLEREMLQRFFAAVTGEVEFLSKQRWQARAAGSSRLYGEVYSKIMEEVTLPPIVVAHHAQFDLRCIWQRAIILGVQVPDWWPHDAKAWDTTRVQDTMLMWAGVGQRIGLDRLCRALGIDGKEDMDGSKVWDAVREGRIAEVADYCGDDIDRLRNVHRKIVGLPHIGYGFIADDNVNGGSQACWDANPPVGESVRDVHRVIEAEFDYGGLQRAEYLAEADALREYEEGTF